MAKRISFKIGASVLGLSLSSVCAATSAQAQAAGQSQVPAPANAPSTSAGSAPAASSDAAALSNDIIVTAQKRVENVQEVPVAVTVVSADQLARRGTQSIQDLSQASASLEFTAPSAAPGGGAFVRGIGTNQIGNATAASSVSVVLDGVVLGNANISDIFDVERVEVLKGPQGTLFGSSVSAGVLNITSKAPRLGKTSLDLSTEFGIKAVGSEYSRNAVRSALNVPVSDNSALRIASYFFNNYGLSTDRTDGQVSNTADYGFRGRYLWDISDTLTFNLIGDYSHGTNHHPGGLLWRAATPGSLLAQALTACGLSVGPNNVDNCAGYPNFSTSDIGGASGQFDLKLGTTTLTSITSYRRVGTSQLGDIIGIAPDIARQYLQNCNFVACSPVVSLTSGVPGDPEAVKRSLFTQELRAASDTNHHFEWVTGAYFQRATFADRQHGQLIAHPAFLGFDLILGDGVANTKSDAEDYAAFANGTFYIQDATRLIAGARYTHSRIFEQRADPINAGVPDTYYASTTANALTWRAGVQHDFSHSTMVYATISTGYKAPQINDVLTATVHYLTPIKAEKPTSYEIGFKQTLLGNRLYFDADAFYTRVSNFQTQSCVPTLGGILCSNINVDHVTSKGVEAELFGHIARNTTVNVSAIYNDAKYPGGFRGADQTLLAGQQLNYAPRFKTTISLEQQVPLSERYALVFGADATIRTKQSMYLSADPKYVVPGQTLLNLRATLEAGEVWSASLFARNVTNQIYPTQIYPSDAFAQGGLWQILDPNSRRVVGLQLGAHF